MEANVREGKNCKIAGCKRPYRAKGYCNVHYRKWRHGEMEVKPRYRLCGEENCKKPTFKKGYCEQHYSAWSASKKPQAPAQAPVAVAPTEPPKAAAAPAEIQKKEELPAESPKEEAKSEEKPAE